MPSTLFSQQCSEDARYQEQHTIHEITDRVDEFNDIGCHITILIILVLVNSERSAKQLTISQNLYLLRQQIFATSKTHEAYLGEEVISPHAEMPSTYGQLKKPILTFQRQCK
jgi:hypothetical protein